MTLLNNHQIHQIHLKSLKLLLNDSMSFLAFAIVSNTMLNLLFKSKFLASVFLIFILKKKKN